MNNKKHSEPDFDAIAIGAGFAGLGLIHYLREAGLSIRVFDKASDVGGTWTWNRYPGAATDSEGYYYCLSFSKEILQDWTWSQRYPGWEETLRYMHFVADRCDMWPHIQLNTEIASAAFDAAAGIWTVTSSGGETWTCKYFISAMGMISEPNMPKLEGMNDFAGPCFHSSRWPQEGLDYAGKRVGIIGAGATAVQMLPVMAETAASVTLFQRTPNYVLPAVQKPMTPEWEKEIKDNYDEILNKCRHHVFGMAFDSPVGRTVADTPPEEVQRVFEEHWPRGSFRFCFETFDDLLADADSNEAAAEFIRSKIREKVNDPDTAELLTPRGYPLFAKRPPLDHGFY
ncbi:MAG: flavin-containing monooxygenase, partial [Luminiphilus sp.]